MRDNYYRGGEGFLCVYAVTMLDTFKNVEGFVEQVLKVKEDEQIPIVIVGNKIDLGDGKRQVTTAEGEKLAAQLKCRFVETSAKTNTNVEQAFLEVVRRVMERKKANADNKKEPSDASSPSKKSRCILL